MGYDITFHPIGMDELQHFFFDVVDDASKAKSRAKEISKDPKRQQVVLKLYQAFPIFIQTKMPIGASFCFGAAVIAGFLHPYWYARGHALTFLAENHLPEFAKLFVPLGQVGKSSLSEMADKSRGLIRGNESASGVIPPARIAKAQNLLESMAHLRGTAGLPLLETALDADSLDSLRAALAYCRAKKLGMIEASDVVVPLTNQCMTDDKNLRAPYLGKMEP